jgi:hypothetical protein
MPKPSLLLHKKRYSVVFTLDITIPEITKETATHLIKQAVRNYRQALQWPATWEKVDRQERLVQALLQPKHAPVLDRLLQHAAILEVWYTFGGGVESDAAFTNLLAQLGIPDDLYAILSPVIATLPEDDQHWFADAANNNAFYESILYWYEAITAEITGAYVLEMDMQQKETAPNRNRHH